MCVCGFVCVTMTNRSLLFSTAANPFRSSSLLLVYRPWQPFSVPLSRTTPLLFSPPPSFSPACLMPLFLFFPLFLFSFSSDLLSSLFLFLSWSLLHVQQPWQPFSIPPADMIPIHSVLSSRSSHYSRSRPFASLSINSPYSQPVCYVVTNPDLNSIQHPFNCVGIEQMRAAPCRLMFQIHA